MNMISSGKMTLTEKILSKKAKKNLFAGSTYFFPVNLAFGTDGTTPIALDVLKKYGVSRLSDKTKIILINDHFSPAVNISTANNAVMLRKFAKENDITFFDSGKGGISHCLLPELSLIRPFSIVVGADSHTCTHGAFSAFSIGAGSTDLAYVMASGKMWLKVPESIRICLKGRLNNPASAKDVALFILKQLKEDGAAYCAVEFCGDGVRNLSIAERMTICNMMTECGAKNSIFCYDEITEKFMKEHGIETEEILYPDKDARYLRELTVDLNEIIPQIACPYSPANVKDAYEMEGMPVDQVVIGSCTNGSIEDMRAAAHYLKGQKVNDNVRLIVIPGTQRILFQMEKEGILSAMIEAGAVITPSSCGSCMGGHGGVLGDYEVGLYTTNRNFYGRNGASTAKVYLCSPAIASYSAVKGYVSVPQEE